MNRQRRTDLCFLLSAALAASLFITPHVSACTRAMAIEEMANWSTQVLTVRVERVEAAWAEHPKRIETTLTFIVEEALKGQRAVGERMTITAPGGRVGDWEMRMCCAPQFIPGETYLVFLLPEYRTHPVTGMSRGAFHLVTDAAGVRRVISTDGEALTGIGPDGVPVMQRVATTPQPRAAEGVRVVSTPTVDTTARAMTYAEFRATLAPVIEKSTVYPDHSPVARRVQADYSPVPLVTASEEGQAPDPPRGAAREDVQTAPPRAGGQP